MDQSVDVLDRARRELGLSVTGLWWLYFALGGMMTALELDAVLHRALVPEVDDYDLVALALNERFGERGEGYPIAYLTDDD